LLVTEVLAISVRYDSARVGPDRALYGVIVHTGTAARIGTAVCLTTLMVIGLRGLGPVNQGADRRARWSSCIPPLVGNLFAFLSFYQLSGLVLEGPASPYSDRALALAWGLAGFATLLFWAMAILPADLWVSLVRQNGRNLTLGPVLGVAAFLCGLLAQNQWKTLSRATLEVVTFLLRLIFRETVYQPEVRLVGTPSFSVMIAPECSGYEGVGVITALIGLALWLLRRQLRFPAALVLLPLGIILIWLANAVRIAALVALGTSGYSELAVGGFHSLAGWVLILVVGLGLIAWANHSPWFSSRLNHEPLEQAHAARLDGAYLAPAMAVIATAMVTTSLSPGFDRYYPARVIAATIALVWYRKSYSELRFKLSWEALVTGCGVFAFWMALEPLAASPSSGAMPPIRAGLDSLSTFAAFAWILCRVIGSVVTVPIAEELAFRGYMTRRLIVGDFQSIPPGRMTWWSLLVSSFLFGALHGRWFAGTLAGIAYALAYRRRGELSDAVMAHAVTNGLIAITVLTTGAWSLWS
jgi:exosortase E/protease (VPEID-CTERM system)